MPELVRAFIAVAEEERWILTEPPVDPERRARRFEELIASDEDILLVAEVDGRQVGHIAVQGITAQAPPAFGMNVDADARGLGVGSALLAEAIERTRAAGAWKLCLEVFPGNEAGIALYRKFGFVEEGRLRGHYRRKNGELWDAIVMGLAL